MGEAAKVVSLESSAITPVLYTPGQLVDYTIQQEWSEPVDAAPEYLANFSEEEQVAIKAVIDKAREKFVPEALIPENEVGLTFVLEVIAPWRWQQLVDHHFHAHQLLAERKADLTPLDYGRQEAEINTSRTSEWLKYAKHVEDTPECRRVERLMPLARRQLVDALQRLSRGLTPEEKGGPTGVAGRGSGSPKVTTAKKKSVKHTR